MIIFDPIIKDNNLAFKPCQKLIVKKIIAE